MKCIKDVVTGEVFKTTDNNAYEAVYFGTHKYCPKHEWKDSGRVVKKHVKTRKGSEPQITHGNPSDA